MRQHRGGRRQRQRRYQRSPAPLRGERPPRASVGQSSSTAEPPAVQVCRPIRKHSLVGSLVDTQPAGRLAVLLPCVLPNSETSPAK